MESFEWRKYKITFTPDDELRIEVLRLYLRHTIKAKNSFDEKCKHITGYDDKAITKTIESALEVLETEKGLITEDAKAKGLIRHEAVINRIWQDNYDTLEEPYYQLNVVALRQYYEYKGIQEDEKLLRAQMKSNRSAWVGGGIGLSGAISGAVQAAALNVADGAVYSAAGAIKNFAADYKTSRKINKVLKYLRDTINELMEVSLLVVFESLLSRANIGSVSLQKMIKGTNDFVEARRNSKDESTARDLFYNLRLNPLYLEQYEVLIKNFGDEELVFEAIGNKYGLDIISLKDKMMEEVLRKGRECWDIIGLSSYYKEISDNKKKFGINKQYPEEDIMRQRVTLALDKEAEQAKSIDQLRNLLEYSKRVEKSFGYGGKYVKEAKMKLKNIDIAERTAGGKLFDTVEEAKEERKYWAGSVRYGTIEEAEAARDEILAKKRKKDRDQIRQQEMKESLMNLPRSIGFLMIIAGWLLAPAVNKYFAILAVVGTVLCVVSLLIEESKLIKVAIVLGILVSYYFFSGKYDVIVEQNKTDTESVIITNEADNEIQNQTFEESNAYNVDTYIGSAKADGYSEEINGLQIEDVLYTAFENEDTNVIMELGTYKDGTIGAIFHEDYNIIWLGELNRYDHPNGLGLRMNFIASDGSCVDVKWSSYETIDYPIVYSAPDELGVNGSYGFAYQLE